MGRKKREVKMTAILAIKKGQCTSISPQPRYCGKHRALIIDHGALGYLASAE